MEGKENVNDNDSQSKSMIFTEEIPKCGRVSMLFYIPDSCAEKDKLRQLIKENGGNIAVVHECFTYQIACPEDVKHDTIEEHYYKGKIFSSNWITESVEKGELLPKDKYSLMKIANGREFEFNKGKMQYTLREAILVYDWIKDEKLKNSRRTWKKMVDQGLIQCRSAESLKNFWKLNQKLTVEECIELLIKKDAKYCHQYPNPIYPHDGVVIKGNEETSQEEEKSSVKYPLKINKFKETPTKTDESDSTKKKVVVNVHPKIDPDEDITPVQEDVDYEVQVVAQAEAESDDEEIEVSEGNNQLEVQEDQKEPEEQKKKSLASNSTPTKVEDSKSPMRPMDIMKCSQNSLSNFFDGYEAQTKEVERPLKEKKDLLVGLLDDDLSNIKINRPNKANKNVVKQPTEARENIESFINIKNKLKSISKKYDKKFEDVMKLFEQASCRYDVLEEFLQGKVETKNKMWSPLEDMVLTKPDINQDAYDLLIADKGSTEVENRKNFLFQTTH